MAMVIADGRYSGNGSLESVNEPFDPGVLGGGEYSMNVCEAKHKMFRKSFNGHNYILGSVLGRRSCKNTSIKR